MNPKISVLMPCYNCSRYVHKTLKSVMQQTYRNFELVIYDDKSTDNTLEVLKNWQKRYSQIRVEAGKINIGICRVRKLLTSNFVNGEYFIFIDDDDFLHKRALEYLVRNLSPTTDIVVSKHKVFTFIWKHHRSNYDQLGRRLTLPAPRCKLGVKSKHEYILKNKNFFWNKLIRTAFWKKCLSLMPDMDYCEDTFVVYVLFKAKKISLCKYTTYYYRVRKNSLTNSSNWKNIYNFFNDIVNASIIVNELILRDPDIIQQNDAEGVIEQWREEFMNDIIKSIWWVDLFVSHLKFHQEVKQFVNAILVPWLKKFHYRSPKKFDPLTKLMMCWGFWKKIIHDYN